MYEGSNASGGLWPLYIKAALAEILRVSSGPSDV